MNGTAFVLVLNQTNGAELFRDGEQLWASDSDPDLLEALGTDQITTADIGDVLDYLVECEFMSEEEADECAVDSPEEEEEDTDEEDEEDEEAEEPA